MKFKGNNIIIRDIWHRALGIFLRKYKYTSSIVFKVCWILMFCSGHGL